MDDALENLEGFAYSQVERFSKGDKVNCQMRAFVYKTSSITEGEILKALGGTIGGLKITNVVVMNTEKPATPAPTEGPSTEEIIFEVEITMPKREFTEDLRDPGSESFKTLSKDLTSILTKIFEKEVKNFLRIDIIEFREGSIICIFNVITEQDSTASNEEIKEVLTDAVENNETGNFTFTDITVKKKTASDEPRSGDKEITLPDWVIVVIAAFAVMVLLILLMIYLVWNFILLEPI